MHFSTCLHPVRIYNKKLQRYMHVPCGKCESCLNVKQNRWVERCKEESIHWKYVMFVTLKYDDHHVPMLEKRGNHLVSKVVYRRCSQKWDIVNDHIDIELCPRNDFERDYYKHRKLFPYCRFEDIQKFIKRFRKHFREYEKSSSENFKYFISQEYGPGTFRPHSHCLFFFNSERLLEKFGETLSQAWKYGSINYSLARRKDSCAAYVAKYVCGTTQLPSCYTNRQIRAKFSFSRLSDFGLGFLHDGKIQEILISSASKVGVYNASTKQIDYVPLPKNVENKIFPRFTLPFEISDYARIALYKCYDLSGQKSWPEFRRLCLWSTSRNKAPFGLEWEDVICRPDPSLLDKVSQVLNSCPKEVSVRSITYIINEVVKKCFALDMKREVKSKKFEYSSLYSLYRTSKTFCENCKLFNLDYEAYVDYIDKYFVNKDYDRLKSQMEFEEEYSKTHPVDELIHIDEDMYYNLSNNNFDNEYLTICESFLPNGELINLQDTKDYKLVESISHKQYNDSLKNKAFNERFDICRFNTTLKHFGYKYNKKPNG